MKEFQPDLSNNTEAKESKIPEFTLQIYFGAHGTREDAMGVVENGDGDIKDKFKRKGLLELFQKADIYVPERAGWTEGALNKFQELSYGRITPEEFLAEFYSDIKNSISDPVRRKNFNPNVDDPMNGFRTSEAEMIYKSFKPIIIFDIPTDHPNIEVLSAHEYGKAGDQFVPIEGDSFNQALAKIKADLKIKSDLHNEREDFMMSRIYPSLEEVFKQRPDLRKKSDLQVLMFLGAVHTRVKHKLSSYGVKIDPHYSRLPFVYDYEHEVRRIFSFGKGVNNELMAHVLLEKLCSGSLHAVLAGLTQDNHEIGLFIRKVVSKFTSEEIKKIYEAGPVLGAVVFFDYLKEKQISQPSNRADLISFISGFKPK